MSETGETDTKTVLVQSPCYTVVSISYRTPECSYHSSVRRCDDDHVKEPPLRVTQKRVVDPLAPVSKTGTCTYRDQMYAFHDLQ